MQRLSKITIHIRNCKSSVVLSGFGGRSKEKCKLLNGIQICKFPMSPKSWSWKPAQLMLERNELQNSSLFIWNLNLQFDLAWAQSSACSCPRPPAPGEFLSNEGRQGEGPAHTDWGGHFKKEPGCSFTHNSCWGIAKAAQVWAHNPSAHLSLFHFHFLMLFTSLTLLSSSSEPFLIKQIVKLSLCQTETSVEAA